MDVILGHAEMHAAGIELLGLELRHQCFESSAQVGTFREKAEPWDVRPRMKPTVVWNLNREFMELSQTPLGLVLAPNACQGGSGAQFQDAHEKGVTFVMLDSID